MTKAQAGALTSEIDGVMARAKELVKGKSEEHLLRRPPSGGWSVGENLRHLVLTADAMLPLIEAGIAELERSGKKSSSEAGLGFVGWLLTKMIDPPSRFKVATTAPFEPLVVPSTQHLMADFGARHEKLRGLIQRATGLDTASAKIVSPFKGSAKYNVYAAMRIVLAHDRRHLQQALRIG